MSQFRTKREAEEVAKEIEAKAARWRERAQLEEQKQRFAGLMAADYRADAKQAEAEAARIRALLSSLPDGDGA